MIRKADTSVIKNVEQICEKFGFTKEDVLSKFEGIISERFQRGRHLHWFYFALASLILPDMKNALEIGTGIGQSTRIISHLFPESNIYTIDVPECDVGYEMSVRARKGQKRLSANIGNSEKIKFIESNSFFLPSLSLPDNFEFIFVDGYHHYPAVAWDMMFAYNRLASTAILFAHDFQVDDNGNDVHPTLDYIKSRIKEEVFIWPGLLKMPDIRGKNFAPGRVHNFKVACIMRGIK